MNLHLAWHDYKYFDYEKLLARREVQSILQPTIQHEIEDGISLETNASIECLKKLVYFKSISRNGEYLETLQSKLERTCATNGLGKRQSTRYSVHGFHDYRGKFNPQIVRGILNALGIYENKRILDPFCGSGTSLVECAHNSLDAIGCDINPLAVYIANAKLKSLNTKCASLRIDFQKICHKFDESPKSNFRKESVQSEDGRIKYLSAWFDEGILADLEKLRAIIQSHTENSSTIFLGLLSDLLRDYSQQEPSDLRIRRRRTPLPNIQLYVAFQKKVALFLDNLSATQEIAGVSISQNRAILCDSKIVKKTDLQISDRLFDAVITSPPYATALPYIDTQRLSLIWLGLLMPEEIKTAEAMLTGSREFYGLQKKQAFADFCSNSRHLPQSPFEYCLQMQDSLGKSDGFRRQNVPVLLYRYLCDMRDMFASVLPLVNQSGVFALLIGHNRTTLGGKAISIDTPNLLRMVAENCGWHHNESISFQPYHRYGLHSANAVVSETLLVLQRP